tara:strand:+ start:2023 stop:2613 length:591 start_codon:yes stop_codon:yes gene_type:complete
MLNKNNLIYILQNLYTKAKSSYDEFNLADAKIGDGDLGITIQNGFEEINLSFDKFNDDLGFNLMLCSQAFVKKSGSSFGTLVAFSLMNVSKYLKGKKTCSHEEIIKIFEIILETILEKGKTKLGDKTIADTINLMIEKLKENSDYKNVFISASKEALDNFKGKKILIGRARMFENKTKDLDDPGMFALSVLSEAFN